MTKITLYHFKNIYLEHASNYPKKKKKETKSQSLYNFIMKKLRHLKNMK